MASDRGSAEMCCNVDCGAATVPVEATASAAVASPIKGGEAAAGSGEATAGVGVEAVRAGWLLVGKRCTSRRCIPGCIGLTPSSPVWHGGESRRPGGKCVHSASAAIGSSSASQFAVGPKADGPP
jgi:hypothetical protein